MIFKKRKKKICNEKYRQLSGSLMSFSLEDKCEFNLSARLASFLVSEQVLSFASFKALFSNKSAKVIEAFLIDQNAFSKKIDLRDRRSCLLYFDPTEQSGFIIDLPKIGELENDLLISKEHLKHQESFLYQMSHELKTPLSAMSNYLELLKSENLNEKSNTYVHHMEVAFDLALGQMNSILEFSRLNHQVFVLKENIMDLEQLFNEIYLLFKPLVESKSLAFHIIHQKNFSFKSDESLLKHVLTNLVSNAIKFTEHGSIKIKTNLNNQDKSPTLEIHVIDSGIGMTAAETEHIFDLYSQVHPGISKVYGGTGLGLAIVDKAVSLLNGSISIESHIQVGSTFILEIPIQLASLEDNQKVQEKPILKPKKGLHILVAEDNELSLNATKDLLQKIDLKVSTAKDGRAVISKFLSYPFDLVLMDIQMPFMNGLEATKKIRETDLNIPIIALTANTSQAHLKLCFDAKMNDVLFKPFKVKQLYDIIAKHTKY